MIEHRRDDGDAVVYKSITTARFLLLKKKIEVEIVYLFFVTCALVTL